MLPENYGKLAFQHNLSAALWRFAKQLAAMRTGEEEPPPEAQHKAIRDVIGHCIYGVDVNPMAVELCKVSLWMEALEPGKPLSFLEHRIQPGNSLLGTTPNLLLKGIPDEVFTPIEGDTKEACTKWKRVNKSERVAWEKKQQWLGFDAPWNKLGAFALGLMALDNLADDSISGIREKERLYREAVESADYLDGKFLADAWCAAFVWRKDSLTEFPLTEELFRQIERNPRAFASDKKGMTGEVMRLAEEYRFFHWHLAFPDVFRAPSPGQTSASEHTGWNGGFDLVLGNPPWERVKLQEKEWFAARRPDIANAPNTAARRKMILSLAEEDPRLYSAFQKDLRQVEGEALFIRFSGRYPLCGRGDVNTYAAFAETNRNLVSSTGRVGCIVPSGIALDMTTKDFFQALVEGNELVSLHSFENEEFIFPAVHHFTKFCLLTLSGKSHPHKTSDFLFFARQISALLEEHRHFTLTSTDIALLNPNTKNCCTFRSKKDAEITKAIYRNASVFIRDADDPNCNPWHVTFLTMFHMAADSGLFRAIQDFSESGRGEPALALQVGEVGYLPLYEGKFLWQFNHRFSGYETRVDGRGHRVLPESTNDFLKDPTARLTPYYWVRSQEVESRIPTTWHHQWLMGWRDVTTAITERTVVATVMPLVGVGHTCPLFFPMTGGPTLAACLLANLNSLPLDYVARQKIGGVHLTYSILNQLPVFCPASYEATTPWQASADRINWLLPRVLELVYADWSLEHFARDCGYSGPPFLWDVPRRLIIQCEIDAAFFHFYGLGRPEVEHILDTFNLVRDRDVVEFGEYLTKRTVLELYDAMAEAERTGVSYQTRLDPPPADPRVAHHRKKIGVLAFGSLIGDPGPELSPKIVMRIRTKTPFPVEYGRISSSRGGAPTLVPQSNGSPVSAEILVLDDDVSVDEARDMLWRRERRRECSGEKYVEDTSANSVLVREASDSPWVDIVLHTDFNDAGKIPKPTPADLAARAIQSVRKAEGGKDGISYLINAMACGIQTPLTGAYRDEILKQTKAASLEEALTKAKAL